MRSINKLQLINWHYFDNQIIDFKGMSTLITGDNGAGKSTIIDALQLIFIANLTNIKFNSSAHEKKSERKLLSYLRGKINNYGGFIRNKDFTSYLALEICLNSGRLMLPITYIIGAVFDYSSEQNDEEHKFFKIDKTALNDKLFYDENNFVRTSDQFFYNLKVHDIEYEKYNTIEDYKSDVLHLLGGIKDNFFSILSKGIAFSPITNIRKFAYDYILDEHKVDISLMQDYVERTNEFVTAIEKAASQIEELKQIGQVYSDCMFAKEEAIIYEFILIHSILEQLNTNLENKTNEAREKQLELTSINENIENLEKQVTDLNQDIIDLNEKLSEHSIKVEQAKLNGQIETISSQIDNANRLNENTMKKLKVEYEQLQAMLYALKDYDIEKQLLHKLNCQLNIFERFLLGENEFTPSYLDDYSSLWSSSYNNLLRVENDLKMELEDFREQKSKIEKVIQGLEKNQILSENTPQMKLKKLLQQELKSENGSIEVNMLCEIIDIKNETWRNAIEGVLNAQKFNIVVPPQYVKAAIQIYESNKAEYKIENVGVVDTEKIKSNSLVQVGALSEEIIVNNSLNYVKSYIAYLMGNLIKCNDINQIRNNPRSITKSCMLYQGYVARQIPERNYNTPFIGKEAIKVQLENKKTELFEIYSYINQLETLLESLSQALSYSGDKSGLIEILCNQWTEESKLVELEEILEALNQELFSLDTTPLKLLEEQINQKRNLITTSEINKKELYEKGNKVSVEIGKLNNIIESIQADLKEQEEKINAVMENNPQQVINSAIERWGIEKDSIKPNQYYKDKVVTYENKSSDTFLNLTNLRTSFNDRNLFNADPLNKHNNEYEAFLINLEESEIVDYKEKAQEADKKAQQSFREDFISKLKDQIEKAKSDFNELNHILRDLKFGTDRYRFKVTGHKLYQEYYKMLTDSNLDNGYSIFSPVFDDEYSEVVNQLFEKISGENAEQNADLLDYRTYLDFELMIIDEDGNSTPYSEVALEKSGGETQVPFYVSILASFYHTYHMSRKEDTLRLVIFDEAFNRMDSNRVDEAIEFIKSCGFQTLIVAPTGKVALLAPHFDNSIIVMKEKHQSIVYPITIDEMLEFEVEDYDTEPETV